MFGGEAETAWTSTCYYFVQHARFLLYAKLMHATFFNEKNLLKEHNGDNIQ